MLLKDLILDLEVLDIKGDLDKDIYEIYYDSRQVSENSLFVSIRGFKTDGHLYIKSALEKGAVAILVEEDIAAEGATVIRVKDTKSTMAIIANRFYQTPTQKMSLVGVTGTNGKTSITYLMKSILEKGGGKTGIIGTIANWIGDSRIDAVRTTPESLDLQRLFNDMIQQEIKSCTMEVSSHSLELGRVEGLDFKVGIFTNLTPDHLDFHGTMENYYKAKKRLFYKTSICNVINIDDDYGVQMVEELKDIKTPTLTYGINNSADIYAKNIHMTIKTVTFDMVTPTFTATITIGIPGIFTVYNALAAAAAAYAFKIPNEDIISGLNEFKGVPGRFELVQEITPYAVIVDYAHTPDALENVLKAARGFAENRVITVFGCGGDRDRMKRAIMGEISGKLSDLTVITSDNPRTEEPQHILKMIESGIIRTQGRYVIIEDRKEAIRHALKVANEGDLVLIAGKGHETTQTINSRVYPFDDKKIAMEIAREEEII